MLIKKTLAGWGGLNPKKVSVETAGSLAGCKEALSQNERVLAFGNLRSYGDSCLNSSGIGLEMKGMDKFISFEDGLLTCEAGVMFSEIIDVFVPKGYFLPVTPGTKFITVGGAIANDIHGKNHHVAGCFGNHVTELTLLRSDKGVVCCSEEENPELFRATIGGMGLTGVILTATFQMKKIDSPLFDVEHVPFKNLDEFFKVEAESHKGFDYTVSWVDCVSKGKNLGRGIMMRGNHSKTKAEYKEASPKLVVPFNFPSFCLNKFSIKAFNELYYWTQSRKKKPFLSTIDPFFYPLDSIGSWNRIYGKRGFFQYQFVLTENKVEGLKKIFKLITDSGEGSFLAVLKSFGDVPSKGMMSFPKEGPTLALDFPNNGKKTLELFKKLDELVLECGGRLYPAKDARMSKEMFLNGYTEFEEFKKYIDPKISSDFFQRIS